MEAQNIRSLQEAYSQVYQVDEELTGSRRQIAIEKGAPSRLIHGVHGSEKNGKITNFQTKLSGRGRKGKPKSGLNLGGFEDDRGKGNKAARRAGKFVKNTRDDEKDSWDESYDYYDIILSHLLDEGYAETPEAAEVIMVNMSEDWRESIVEADSLAAFQARREKRRRAMKKKTGYEGHDYSKPPAKAAAEREERMRKFINKD